MHIPDQQIGVAAARCLVLLALCASWQPAQAQVRSDYALSAETCGGFPKLRITMQPGFCAGLVAAKDDGLLFPRSIVQLPDTRFFVVADRAAGIRRRAACCCSIRPRPNAPASRFC